MLSTKYTVSGFPFPTFKHGDLRIDTRSSGWNNQYLPEVKTLKARVVSVEVYVHGAWQLMVMPSSDLTYLLDTININIPGEMYVRVSHETYKVPYVVEYINPDLGLSCTIKAICTSFIKPSIGIPHRAAQLVMHRDEVPGGVDIIRLSKVSEDGSIGDLLGEFYETEARRHFFDIIYEKMLFKFKHVLYLDILNIGRVGGAFLAEYMPKQEHWLVLTAAGKEFFEWQ